jgi:hypothetical protein
MLVAQRYQLESRFAGPLDIIGIHYVVFLHRPGSHDVVPEYRERDRSLVEDI